MLLTATQPGGGYPAGAPITVVEFNVNFLDNIPQSFLFGACNMEMYNPGRFMYGQMHVGLMQSQETGPYGKLVNWGGYVYQTGMDAGVPYQISHATDGNGNPADFYIDTGTQYNMSGPFFPPSQSGSGAGVWNAAYNWPYATEHHIRVQHQGGGTWRAIIDGVVYRDSYWPGVDHVENITFFTEMNYLANPPNYNVQRMRWSQITLSQDDGTEYHLGPVIQYAFGTTLWEKTVYMDEIGLVHDINSVTPGPIVTPASFTPVIVPYIIQHISTVSPPVTQDSQLWVNNAFKTVSGVPLGYIKSLSGVS